MIRLRRRLRPVVLLAITSVLLAACGSSGSGARDHLRLPHATLTAVASGDRINADELTGPLVINLWATWCGPCRKELPAFQAVHDDLGDTVRFAGVNQGDTGGAVTSYLGDVGVTFDQYLDEDGALSDAFRATGLPVTAIVSAEGTVLTVHSGALTEDALRALIHDTLAVG